jgi:C6 transcription factor Pro1
MDGGVRQEQMAEQLKREVKERPHRRPGERAVHISDGRLSDPAPTLPPSLPPCNMNASRCTRLKVTPDCRNDDMERSFEASSIHAQRGRDCSLANEDTHEGITFGRSDTILLMFYLEHLLPFLFPFYRPSLLQGGRAWILEMMISSPVVRKATLCQSSYFFSLARGTSAPAMIGETVLAQTRDAFGVLRQALQVMDGPDLSEHLHGAVRTMSSIVQIQRFEIAALSFNNCQTHLNAALALFRQLIEVAKDIEPSGVASRFDNLVSRLGPPSRILPTQFIQVPSAEQAAFRFSSSLLILDDIIASTILQEQPKLYDYHCDLLTTIHGNETVIDLASVVGCQNMVLVQIGEIAALDGWKQQSIRAGTLNVMELVQRATVIKSSQEDHLRWLETGPLPISKDDSLLGIFTADFYKHSETSTTDSSLVTRVWAHAGLIYLHIVVSGWQPASTEVRHHVGQIIRLLTLQLSHPTLLRTVAWPFCVAGCLAEQAQRSHLREMVEALQPPSVFGTVHKALEIMEDVWRTTGIVDAGSRDLATCFRDHGGLVLLV